MNAAQPKCSIGIFGLDRILNGGLPSGRLYLIEGNPGVGKTTLAIQFLLEGMRLGERCLYVTLSETRSELLAVAEGHGWNLEGISIIELSAIEAAIAKSPTMMFPSAEVELNQLTKMLTAEIESTRPERLVLDSLSEMRLMAQNPLRYRREILRLKQHLATLNCTALMLDDRTQGSDVQVHSIVHGTIVLHAAPVKYGMFRRSLTVSKLRGVPFREGNHDYTIEKGGLKVYARLIAAEHHRPFTRKQASSNEPALDALLGGGLHYGTSNLIIGPAGSGKSTISMMFASAAAGRGQRAYYYLFDETKATLKQRAEDLCIDVDRHLNSGMLQIQQIDPAQISPGQLAFEICQAVEQEDVKVLVLDSLNGYLTAMPQDDYLHLHLHELLTYLNQQGVMTVMVLAQHGLIGATGAPVDISYLADSVIITRYFEALGRIRKAISIIKKRSGPHEPMVRELTMGAGGVSVGPPLDEFQGVLTGVPSYVGNRERPASSDSPPFPA
jgi:circadian clock protein KaiC